MSARYRDYAQVGAAAVVTLDAGGACSSATLVLLRVAATPHLADIDAIVRGSGLERTRSRGVTALIDELDPPGRRRGLRHLPAQGRRRPRAASAPGRRRARRSGGGIVTARDTATYPVRVQVERHLARGQRRAAPHARRLPARGLDLTGTHLGCEHGFCGDCNVLLDGQAVRSCLMLAVQADGHEVETVEGLAERDGRCTRSSRRSSRTTACSAGSAPPDAHDRQRVPAPHPGAERDEIREAISGVTLPLHRLPADRRVHPGRLAGGPAAVEGRFPAIIEQDPNAAKVARDTGRSKAEYAPLARQEH